VEAREEKKQKIYNRLAGVPYALDPLLPPLPAKAGPPSPCPVAATQLREGEGLTKAREASFGLFVYPLAFVRHRAKEG
jgi:hypothetical protein